MTIHDLNLTDLRKDIDIYLISLFDRGKMKYTIKAVFHAKDFPISVESSGNVDFVVNILFDFNYKEEEQINCAGVYFCISTDKKICGYLLHNDRFGNTLFQMIGSQNKSVVVFSGSRGSFLKRIFNWIRGCLLI